MNAGTRSQRAAVRAAVHEWRCTRETTSTMRRHEGRWQVLRGETWRDLDPEVTGAHALSVLELYRESRDLGVQS